MNININPFILLSIVNMKLRDYYDSLERLTEVERVSLSELLEKLDSIGYVYSDINNQFISKKA
ncbi:MAG: DUF4250 domain-containing protein [Bacilli bacterium]